MPETPVHGSVSWKPCRKTGPPALLKMTGLFGVFFAMEKGSSQKLSQQVLDPKVCVCACMHAC